MAEGFATFLDRSLRILQQARPNIYSMLENEVRSISLNVTVDGETTGLRSQRGSLHVGRVAAPHVLAETRGRCVLGLVDGAYDLAQAVRSGALILTGDRRHLIVFDNALRLFVNGAIRVREMRDMIDDYRKHVDAPAKGRRDGRREERSMAEESNDTSDGKFPPLDSRLAVTIFGAGVAGLTVAQELVERGFKVKVWEPKTDVRQPDRGCDVGGMARSQWSSADRPAMVSDKPVPPSDDWEERKADDLQPLPFRFYLRYDPEHKSGDGLSIAASGMVPTGDGVRRYSIDPKEVLTGLRRDVADRRLAALYAEGIYQKAFLDSWSQRTREEPEKGPLNEVFHYKVDAYGDFPRGERLEEGHWRYEVNDRRVDFYERRFSLDDPSAWFDGDPRTVGMVHFLAREYQLPGEHGYRFFPAFYHHLFDTLKRIPLLQAVPKSDVSIAREKSDGIKSPAPYDLVATGRTVFDNIVPATSQAIAYGDRHQPPVFPRFRSESFEGMLRQISTLLRWRVELAAREPGASPLKVKKPEGVDQKSWDMRSSGMQLTPRDLARFNVRLIKYIGSCPERRKQYERMSWWDFLGADTFSPEFQRGQNEWPRALIAMSALEVDARTQGSAVSQLLIDQIRQRGYRDGVLNGPTSDSWFAHWRAYLEQQGVEFNLGGLDGLAWVKQGDQDRLVPAFHSIDRRSGEAIPQDPMDGYFVLALPIQELQPILKELAARAEERPPKKRPPEVGRDLERACRMNLGTWEGGSLAELDQDHSDGTPLRNFHGIQYYFDEELTWLNGHTFFAHAPWGLSAVAQSGFWAERPTWNVGYRGVLSVIVGVWNRPGLDIKTTAWTTKPADLAKEIWHQVELSVCSAAEYGQNFNVPKPRYWRLNQDLEWLESEGHYRNKSPFLISRPGEWAMRPGELPATDNKGNVKGRYNVFHGIVLAGTHMKTFTRLTSMEAANESGRHAANAILADAGIKSLPGRVSVWSMEERELPDLQWLRELDARYLARGIGHPLDDQNLEDLLVASYPGVLRKERDSNKKKDSQDA